MEDNCIGEIMNDFDITVLGLWKIYHFSPKRRSALVSFQVIYVKKTLKILKVVVTR